MEDKKYSFKFTLDEIVLLIGGVGLVHKESAKSFYDSLEGNKSKKDELSVEEFDKIHKLCMSLYDILGDKLKQINEEEE